MKLDRRGLIAAVVVDALLGFVIVLVRNYIQVAKVLGFIVLFIVLFALVTVGIYQLVTGGMDEPE